MTIVTISFSKADVTPPVFVAGSFTDWNPVELEHSAVSGDDSIKYKYSKTFEIAPGHHHYKLRLGPGDWWVCDEAVTREFDSSGNENNVLNVEATPTKTPAIEKPSAKMNGTADHRMNGTHVPLPNGTAKHATINPDPAKVHTITTNGHDSHTQSNATSYPDHAKSKTNQDKLPSTDASAISGSTTDNAKLDAKASPPKHEDVTNAADNAVVNTVSTSDFAKGNSPDTIQNTSPTQLDTATKSAESAKMEDMSTWKSKDKPLPPKSAMKQPGNRRAPVYLVPSDTRSVTPAPKPEGKRPSFFARLFCSRNLVMAALFMVLPLYMSWIWAR